MKSLFLSLLFTFSVATIIGQDNRWSVGAENTLNISNATSPRPVVNDDSFRAAYNAFLRAEYQLTNRLSATMGFGYLQTREFESPIPFDEPYLESINITKSHHYVVAPVGISYSFGSVFIRPEIGVGFNTANTSTTEYIYYDVEIIKFVRKSKDTQNYDQVNKMTYPLLLTIGTEVPISSFKLIFALQGYYTLNTIGKQYTNQRHAYGFGTSIGVKF